MKKTVKSAAVLVVLALCLVLLAGCADSSTSPVGIWTREGNTLTIIEHKTTLNCKYNGSTFVFDLGSVKMISRAQIRLIRINSKNFRLIWRK